MKKTKTPETYFQTLPHWRAEALALREVLLTSELSEEIKWGAPCYTLMGKNIVGLGAYTHYFGLWFHQGSLLADPSRVLINAQEGVTKALRQWRMTTMDDIEAQTILAYVEEAIDNVEAGKTLAPNRNKPLVIPKELSGVFTLNPEVKLAFGNLKLGRKREYADYISNAKQDVTKQRRLSKIIPMIIADVGLNDKYR